MEKLKAMVPDDLKQMVADSNPDDIPRTSSSLLRFLLNLPIFHQMISDLANPENALCAKNKDVALASKQDGNKCFLRGDYATALASYSRALRVAPIDATDGGQNLVATIYQNRASLLYKTGLLMECLRDCNRALQIYPDYAKAWYRRGKANAALGNYEDAMHDLNAAKNVELSLGGKRQIDSELKMILDQYKDSSSVMVQHNENNLGNCDEQQQMKLSCVTTVDKGRGMISQCDVTRASLVHKEEPYALVILKTCRETHCHYCLNELPADAVPCTSCSIPVYCSQHCQLRATGKTFDNDGNKAGLDESHSKNLEKCVSRFTLCDDSAQDECFPEHKHECMGAHWSAVLPSDIVLAGRILVKSVSQGRGSLQSNFLDLFHNYSQIPSESKVEMHIYAIVLLSCLQLSVSFEPQIDGKFLSQTIILIAQIRVNSMAVVRMKSVDVHAPPNQFGNFSPSGNTLISTVEQVPVGQAIYIVGSLFNHSCHPNVHAYFLSRSLFVRATESVATECPLELSYGPQVGEWDCNGRSQFLEEKYSFRCQCSGCSVLNLPDLVFNAFCCVNPSCDGVVLDSCTISCEMHKLKNYCRAPKTQSSDLHLQVDKLGNVDYNRFAHLALERSESSLEIRPGHCLNCGCYHDLEISREAMNKAWISVKRLQEAIVSKDICKAVLANASRALGVLRSILHSYNKRIAEMEDNLAQASCLVGDLQSARDHCKASIKILELLYGPGHVVVGYELVKLSTIQLCLNDHTAMDSINRLSWIFAQYYGSHVDCIVPFIRTLKRESFNLA